MSRTVRPQRVNYCTDADLARLAVASVTVEYDDTDECQICGGRLLVDPAMPGITVHESTGTAEHAERTPCDTQDTVAAALVPGDVVLGPDGWVIVHHVTPFTEQGEVRVYPVGRLLGFNRADTDVVTVQPDADTESSASCQHYIETARYLRRRA